VTATIYELDPSTPSPDDLRTDDALAVAADKLYETQRSGPRTVLAVSLAYLPLDKFIPQSLLMSMGSRASDSSQRDRIRARRLIQPQNIGQIEYIFDIGNWSPFLSPQTGKKYGTLLQILQYPFSRGSIHINPDAPAANPVIDPQYYDGQDGALDLEVQQLAAQFGRQILETKPLSGFVQKRVWPPEDVPDNDLKNWLIDNTITDWHPVGTCAMGGDEGIKAGVVDEQLRVYGINGLRVIDASIMPLQISAHLQATVYAIAEKGSHMILETLRKTG
jgi:choline dehydrogenase-like flavoprotein